jgi:hypothetical protein
MRTSACNIQQQAGVRHSIGSVTMSRADTVAVRQVCLLVLFDVTFIAAVVASCRAALSCAYSCASS